jgi:Family of unknown function (DUF5312)
MSDVFHELSQSLGDEERKALLKRISESLNFRNDVDENIYHKDPDREERKRLIAQDVARLGWFQRFLLWLRQSFSGKTRSMVFTEQKLASLRRHIARKVPGYAGFDTQVLYPRFANRIFELFKAILPLREPFGTLWTQRELFEAILTSLIESKLDAPKYQVDDLISTEEMVEIYAEKETRAAIRHEVAARLESYTDALEDAIFDDLQEAVLPVYYLKELVMFPYHSLFQLFHYVKPEDPEKSEPYFKNASANLAMELIERLYYAVYVLTKIDEKSEIDETLIGDLFRSEDEEDSSGQIIAAVRQSIKIGRRFYKDIPLSDIIRYFRKDPYYQLIFYMPSMNLKDFYLSVLKIRLISNVDEVFPAVRDLYIEREVAKFFHDKRFINFQHYRIYSSIDYKQIGLPFFIHTRTINLVYNYLRSYYREQLQEIVHILERSVIDQNRITRDRLLTHAANIEDLEDKISQFDMSLSTDSEDGKLFNRLRLTLAGDPTHQKMFRTLVVQKDREVKNLLERSHESLGGLSKVFQEVLMSRSDNARIQLRSHYMINNKPYTLEYLLRFWSDHIDQFLKLFNQVLRIEKGRAS